MKNDKILAKMVGAPNLPQVREELAAWEHGTGVTPTSAEDWTHGPDRALEYLEELGVQAHLLPWSEDPTKTACVFAFDGDLFITYPGDETSVALWALHFVVLAKSAVT